MSGMTEVEVKESGDWQVKSDCQEFYVERECGQ